MHFLIQETLSLNLMYIAACYPVGTNISKTAQNLLLCCSTLWNNNDQTCFFDTRISAFSNRLAYESSITENG